MGHPDVIKLPIFERKTKMKAIACMSVFENDVSPLVRTSWNAPIERDRECHQNILEKCQVGYPSNPGQQNDYSERKIYVQVRPRQQLG